MSSSKTYPKRIIARIVYGSENLKAKLISLLEKTMTVVFNTWKLFRALQIMKKLKNIIVSAQQ